MPAKLSRSLVALLVVALVALCTVGGARAQTCDPFADACAEEQAGAPAPASGADAGVAALRLVFFWGVRCPHCHEAEPFVAKLEAEGVAVERVEVRESEAGRARFLEEIRRLGVTSPGIPMFVVGDRAVLGWRGEATEGEVRALLGGARPSGAGADVVDLPIFGRLDPSTVSLPWFTFAVGLVDGINPCAFYVLVVMLGILLHVRSRTRIALFGGTFVLMSGVVYFLFMTAWLNAFLFAGVAEWLTRALGVVLIGMGLVNLKELAWFKKGVSLMIPEKAKPGLFRRMRGVAQAGSLPAAMVGIVGLAFVVNLVELGCTLGLPAVYTRVLSLRDDLSAAGRYAYLALYNVAYVIPLAAIVLVYAVTMRRLTLSEKRAKVLKAISGALLVLFGLVFVLAPQVLG